LMNEHPPEGDDFEAYEKKLLELVHEIARRKPPCARVVVA
jgi:hypothetical protein